MRRILCELDSNYDKVQVLVENKLGKLTVLNFETDTFGQTI